MTRRSRAFTIVGWFLVAPVLAIRTYYEDDESDTTDADDPIATLRERYARGELTEAEFERRLDRLLESEAASRSEAADGTDVASGARNRERITER